MDVAYTQSGPDKLRIDITVTNTGSELIRSAGGTLMIMDFSVVPIGTDHDGTAPLALHPRWIAGLRGVPALHVGLGT